MSRPCVCDKENCRLCFLYHNDDRYKKFWDKAPARQKTVKTLEAKPSKGCGCNKS